MKTIFLTLILISAAFSGFAQQIDVATLSKSQSGQRVLAYFAAFNSGDEQKLKEFFLDNLTADALQQRPVEPRLEFHRQIRNDFQTLEIKKIVSVSDTEIELFAEGKTGGWAQYTFGFEKNSPYKMRGWQTMRTDAPETTEKSRFNAPTSKTEFLSTVEKYLNEQVSADNFSGVVLVAKNDQPIFSNAYGLASKENKKPNNADTKFNLGSINKIFTRISIGQLVKQGKISFDDKLGKYLPDYPNKEAAEKVTIRHLVTMKSGVGDFFGERFMALPKDKLRKNSDFIPLFSGIPLAFEPGTNEQYSNGGYILLGAIIEKVTGQSYYDYVRENIFKTARMTNTDSFETDKTPANTANGYTRRNPKNELVNNINSRPFRGSSAGGGYSNAADLLKFSLALKSGILSIPDDDGNPRKDGGLGIAGGSDGINAVLIINPQTGYTIIVLSNYDPPSAEKVSSQIRDWTKQIKE
ncbi:MAG: serine hydrolase domain-containing protein [Actinomycetota bacterium]